VEPFGCLALACLLPRRWPVRPLLVAVLVAAAVAWGLVGMRGRLDLRQDDGLPADPVVRRTAVSWQASRQIQQFPIPPAGLVILQPPLVAETAAMARQLGEERISGSALYHALGGDVGPRLLLGDDRPVQWANGLRRTPEAAFVALDAGAAIKPWGPTDQALLNQVLVDVALGFFERARLHLLRASLLAGQTLTVVFDPDVLPVSLDRTLANADPFVDHLEQGRRRGQPAHQVDGLVDNFHRLLAACTGRPVESFQTPSSFGAEAPDRGEEP
jgi:hypothetical protein